MTLDELISNYVKEKSYDCREKLCDKMLQLFIYEYTDRFQKHGFINVIKGLYQPIIRNKKTLGTEYVNYMHDRGVETGLRLLFSNPLIKLVKDKNTGITYFSNTSISIDSEKYRKWYNSQNSSRQ